MKRANMALVASLLGLSVIGGGCSTVMEATRPDGTNLNKFVIGEKRVDVVGQIGAALSTIQDGDQSCDVYKMHTKGTNAYGKTGIIVTEAAADVFTLGLAEALMTPGEAASAAHAHSVMFCYDTQNKLVVLKDAGKVRDLTK